MTVSAAVPSASYLENGVTVSFAAPFYYRSAAELVVERIASDGTVTQLARPAQWDATAAVGDAGGTVTLVTAGASGNKLRIRRATGRAQATDIVYGGAFSSDAVEAELDRLSMIDDELDWLTADTRARALLVPANETIGLLPNAGNRSSKVLGFAADGSVLLSDLAALVQSVAAGILSTALAAQTAAVNAKVSAEAARDTTLTSFHNFIDQYYGPYAADPLTDPDGGARTAGDLYYNTTVPEMRIWTGAAWVAAYVSGTGFVAKGGDTMTGKLNLLASAAGTSGLNLGVGADVTAPNNGDVWLTAAAIFARINGATRQLATLDGTESLSNKSLPSPTSSGAIYDNGSVRGNVTAMAALDVDCSLGNCFTKTIAANSTFTFSNAPASRAYGFVLRLTYTSGTITWPAAVKWPSDTAPSFVAGKFYELSFTTVDGGTTWHGASIGPYSA